MFILCMPSDNDCDQTKSSVDCYEPHTYTWSQVSGLWSVYTEGCMLLEDFLLLIVWKFMIQKIIYGLFFYNINWMVGSLELLLSRSIMLSLIFIWKAKQQQQRR